MQVLNPRWLYAAAAVAWGSALAAAPPAAPVDSSVAQAADPAAPGAVAPGAAAAEAQAPVAAAPVAQAPVAPAPTQGEVKTNAAAAAANPNLGSSRLLGARAAVDFRSLVFDRDPSNTRIAERYLAYFLQLEVRPFARALVFARTSASQTFVVEDGDSPFLLDDSAVGFSYTQTLDLKPIDRELSLTYTGMINFPTSRVSVNLNPFFAPELRAFAYINVIHRLDFGMLAAAQYRFHKYAERAGLEGGMNDRLRMATRPFFNYTIWDFGDVGQLYASVGVSMSWRLRYPSRDSYVSPASDQAPWSQVFGWDASVGFATFQSRLFVTAALQQGGAVMRDGLVSPRFLQPDETEFSFGFLGRY